ncbi:hypothetical protein Acr_01g0005850 [Actinidia rufa]|uniref:Uncharacterized protein n=1 Tax=Actinidia rufa TaxID=165716 RepID=A0A7J0E3Q3_9ERIC|nr:hypothetical protein Acr_01g0005850 [Actinidia rufa]
MVYTSYTPMYYTSLHDLDRLDLQVHPPVLLQEAEDSCDRGGGAEAIEAAVGQPEVAARLVPSDPQADGSLQREYFAGNRGLCFSELLYAKCISEDEYHSSKRPLLQRLAVQGVEIEARDIVVFAPKESSEDWPVIDLKEEKCKESSNSKTKPKNGSSVKKIFGFTSSHKSTKGKEDKGLIDPGPDHFALAASAKNELGLSKENPFWDGHVREKESEMQSILMSESLPPEKTKVDNRSGSDKGKKNVFRTLFQKEEKEGYYEQLNSKSAKKQWGFDGLKKWKRIDSEDETAPLPLSEKSDSEAFLGLSGLVSSPVGERADTKQIKRKLHSNGSPSDFFIDKVLHCAC